MDKFEIAFEDLSPEAQERWKKFIEPHTAEGMVEDRLELPVATVREGCPADAGSWSHDRGYLYSALLSAFEEYAADYDRDYLADDKEVNRILDIASENIFRIYSHTD